MTSRLIDGALDRSIVGGYTRLGYAARERGWEPTGDEPLAGRVAAITGATSGIGLAAAELLARRGARLILLVRDLDRGARARAELAARTSGAEIELRRCDLASLGSLRDCAASLREELRALDLLVNNAGVLSADRNLSADGLELCFATNVVGPFLLTALLVPLLCASAPGRVITVSSGGMYAQRLHVDDLQMDREPYDGVVAYARSKRAEVVLNELWAERHAPDAVAFHAMHPGWVDTPGLSGSLPRFRRALRPLLRTPEQGADTIAWLAVAHRSARAGSGTTAGADRPTMRPGRARARTTATGYGRRARRSAVGAAPAACRAARTARRP